jgi:hypothetical protein
MIMKKIIRLTGIVIASLIVLILAAAILIPVLFRDKIKTKVQTEINSMVNAQVKFQDYKLSLFKAFPNAAFSINDVSVVGKDQFLGDTLAYIKSCDIVFNLASIFSSSGYEVKSIVIDRPLVNAKVLKDGKANWDIMKETTAAPETTATEPTGTSSFKVVMKQFRIDNARIKYTDASADMTADLKDLNFLLSGDMTSTRTNLAMNIDIAQLTYGMSGVNYLNKAKAELKANLDARLDSMIFVLKDNYLKLNDIKIVFAGKVAMPADDIFTDITFNTPETSFKSLLSMIPAIYMKGYENLKASGTFALDGNVKGTYSDKDSTMPNAKVNMLVENGVISYPDLPEKITAINVNARVDYNGTDMDKTTVDVSKFHLELAGNPFDIRLHLATPISDPSFDVNAVGKIDLAKLQKAVPMDSISLSGLIDMAVTMSGRMSMVDKQQYDKFTAEGKVNIKSMLIAMTDMPAVSISDASFVLTPAYSEMTKLNMKVGDKSDFSLQGRLENYIPYIFSKGIIKGKMTLTSALIDANNIMSKMKSTETTTAEDTTSLAVVVIPRNISFVFDASVKKLIYENLEASEFKGNIVVNDGVVTLNNTGMQALGGSILMNATYDTRDTTKPTVKADLNLANVGVKESFNAFNTVKMLAPVANGINGNISVNLKYDGLLSKKMMPIVSSINGLGSFKADQLQIVKSDVMDKAMGLVKMPSGYSKTLQNISASFSIKNGRVYVKPFDTKLGNVKLNIGGDQGLDKTMNFTVKAEIPSADLGSAANSLISSLTSKAAGYGVNIKPSDVVKLSLNVGGTYSNPTIKPFFGGSSSEGSVASGVTSSLKEQATDKVKAEATAETDKLFKEAETQAQKVRDEAASAAKSIRDEADKQAANLVKEGEAKGPLAGMAAKKAAEKLKSEADKKATKLETEANAKADKILADAKQKSTEVINK